MFASQFRFPTSVSATLQHLRVMEFSLMVLPPQKCIPPNARRAEHPVFRVHPIRFPLGLNQGRLMDRANRRAESLQINEMASILFNYLKYPPKLMPEPSSEEIYELLGKDVSLAYLTYQRKLMDLMKKELGHIHLHIHLAFKFNQLIDRHIKLKVMIVILHLLTQLCRKHLPIKNLLWAWYSCPPLSPALAISAKASPKFTDYTTRPLLRVESSRKGRGLLKKIGVVRKHELTPKASSMYREATRFQKQAQLMKKRVQCFKSRLKLAEKFNNTDYFQNVIERVDKTIYNFICSQITNQKLKSRGRRFTHEDKILALSLLKQSAKGYKLLSKFFLHSHPEEHL
uniref:Uncharacterized protein n=1 Tax=Timema poppense TaxID=170557 RepID=A0A7R9D185_TIMPO|nr:unnamed protein product [Timema poppensis]